MKGELNPLLYYLIDAGLTKLPQLVFINLHTLHLPMSEYNSIEERLLDNRSNDEGLSYDKFDLDQDETDYDEVYDEGWDAFSINNKQLSDNPYEPNSDEYFWWEDGFKDAEEQYFNNDYQI